MRMLDLGSGRDWTLIMNDKRFTELDTIAIVDRSIPTMKGLISESNAAVDIYGEDVFEFLEQYPDRDFTRIHSRRFFEHMSQVDILYMLYLLYEVSAEGAYIDIIVPDFEQISDMVKTLDPNVAPAIEFNGSMISIITELFNTEDDPHRSIWTQRLGRYYIELESYWEVVDIKRNMKIDNRNWYMHFRARSKRGS